MGTSAYHMLIAFAAVILILGLVLLISKPAPKRSLTEWLLPFRHHSVSEEAEDWLRRQ